MNSILRLLVLCTAALLASGTACAVCGDSILEAGEQCDDGNTIDCDGCSSFCWLEGCGNLILECSEQCDPPVPGECDASCIDLNPGSQCANSTLEPGEQCDDGNNVSCDGCSFCWFEACGDGIVCPPEECDDLSSCCTGVCTVGTCGDGWNGGWNQCLEQCDDGNNLDCDGCSASCLIEGTCGDGSLDPNCEECDDGNNMNGDGCSATCLRECASGSLVVIDGLAGIRNLDAADFCWSPDPTAPEHHLNHVGSRSLLQDPRVIPVGNATTDCMVTGGCCTTSSFTAAGIRYYQALAACDLLTEGPY